MNRDKLVEEIRRHEGYVSRPYRDTRGYWTSGCGLLIEPQDSHDDPKWSDKKFLEQEFQRRVNICIQDARSFVGPSWELLPGEAKKGICNLAYNIGLTKLRQFVRFRDAVVNRRWDDAAHELETSRWHGQVGRRGPELVKVFEDLA